jgi:alpha-aminoadipate/glutamate carrier protein LysW
MATKTKTTSCPLCGGEIRIQDGTLVNEIVPCPDCGAELEVTSLSPLTVEEAPEVEEDWGE